MVGLFDRRIHNILIAMKRTKDPQMIRIWENKILELFEKRKAKAYERLEDQSRMVH